jgi:FAD/FMN-containing dehydrogenase
LTPASSWGRTAADRAAREWWLTDRNADLPVRSVDGSMLAHGLGRSYGDVALNEGGQLLRTRTLERFIGYDRARGVLRAEAGVSLDEIIELVLPQGWFIPVTPGTRFVTLGGAVANDVHGKNHQRAGTFGDWVRAIELVRSDGSRQVCSPEMHPDWLQATIGGLGLTGLITWVEIQLVRVRSPWLWTTNRRFADLDEYWQIDAELGPAHEFSVAWVDCAHGARGIYTAADFAAATAASDRAPRPPRRRRMAIDPPFSLVNGLTLSLFNSLYYHRRLVREGVSHLLPFFFPLDAVHEWNRVYGRRGFFQYQCVLPPAAMREAAAELFRLIQRKREGSMLAVFKTFGDRPARGLLSFARAGATLALDFPNRGDATRALFHELDAVVNEAGGALYPAKDARMSAATFRRGYPNLERFGTYIDPGFSSSFWRRVTT